MLAIKCTADLKLLVHCLWHTYAHISLSVHLGVKLLGLGLVTCSPKAEDDKEISKATLPMHIFRVSFVYSTTLSILGMVNIF